MPAETPPAGDSSGRQVSPSLGQVPWTLPHLRLPPGSDLPSSIPPLASGWLSDWDATLLDLELQALPPQGTPDHFPCPSPSCHPSHYPVLCRVGSSTWNQLGCVSVPLLTVSPTRMSPPLQQRMCASCPLRPPAPDPEYVIQNFYCFL